MAPPGGLSLTNAHTPSLMCCRHENTYGFQSGPPDTLFAEHSSFPRQSFVVTNDSYARAMHAVEDRGRRHPTFRGKEKQEKETAEEIDF